MLQETSALRRGKRTKPNVAVDIVPFPVSAKRSIASGSLPGRNVLDRLPTWDQALRLTPAQQLWRILGLRASQLQAKLGRGKY